MAEATRHETMRYLARLGASAVSVSSAGARDAVSGESVEVAIQLF